MILYRKFKIAAHERGLLFEDGNLLLVLDAGKHKLLDPLRKLKVEIVNLRDVYFKHANLDVLARELKGRADVQVVELADHERAFVFIDGRFERILKPGLHVLWTGLRKVKVDVVDTRAPVYTSADLPRVLRGSTIEDEASVLDIQDGRRALVWVGGRFAMALKPGQYLVWKGLQDVRVEVLDATAARLEHRSVPEIAAGNAAHGTITVHVVEAGFVGLWFQDSKFAAELKPGVHAFWTNIGKTQVFMVPLREISFDVAGQEIMTHDKVTLRLNAVVTYHVVDALKSVTVTVDASQALYREAQLALRAVIGARELDALLSDKDAVASELESVVKAKAAEFGLEVRSLGIRDIILPGEMKELMNKVTEAKKAAEAGLVVRREETAAARMQANTAKIIEGNPVLMKLRELEVLEKIAGKANLTVVLGENGGLNERVMKLL
jgi:regulator of protease activity HflC (stomatin/prohibitin superfamily)